MGGVHSLELELKEQTLRTGQRLVLVDLFFDKHEFTENVVDDAKVSVGIVFIRLHYLRACVTHSCWLAQGVVIQLPASYSQSGSGKSVCVCDTSPLFLLCAFLEEHLSEHVLFLVESVIVLDVIVVRLVENTI